MTKIVITDGATLNPGDLSWDDLKNLGSCDIYDATPHEQIIERCHDAEVIITNKVPFNLATLKQLPHLKYIGVTATGYNIVDCEAATSQNVIVTNVPEYSTNAVAQLTFALLLEITNRAGDHSISVHSGKWAQSKTFAYWEHPLFELEGMSIGIVGFGNIGKRVAHLAKAFDMQVHVFTRTPDPNQFPWVHFEDFETLLSNSDIVSLHCPLTEKTNHLMNADTFALMKRDAIFINTSRGGLVDENALANALKFGYLYAAGLDVLSQEPPEPHNPLFNLRNCIITPHIAWATKRARERLLNIVVDNLKHYLLGSAVNVVKPFTETNSKIE
ncbi:MAG: D-2-hydroxyacid dehydrogenase [Gammaproteobacteria bacterium]